MVSDRAQLVLIGSITIAFVIIGFSVVLNSVLFTENIAGGSISDTQGDPAEFEYQSRRDARQLIIRVAHASNHSSQAVLDGRVRDNFTNYSLLISESYADTGSVYANVSYNGTETYGTRAIQVRQREFVPPSGGPETWSPLPAPLSQTEIGWFAVNLNVENVSQDPFKIRVQGDTGKVLTVSMSRNSSVVSQVQVNASVSGVPSATTNVSCEAVSGQVVLDFTDGTANGDTCEFAALDDIEAPYTSVEFVDGDNAEGRYSIVVENETALNTGVLGSCSTSVDPCRTTAVWAGEITTRYQTRAVTYVDNRTVEVYETP